MSVSKRYWCSFQNFKRLLNETSFSITSVNLFIFKFLCNFCQFRIISWHNIVLFPTNEPYELTITNQVALIFIRHIFSVLIIDGSWEMYRWVHENCNMGTVAPQIIKSKSIGSCIKTIKWPMLSNNWSNLWVTVSLMFRLVPFLRGH